MLPTNHFARGDDLSCTKDRNASREGRLSDVCHD
jgi:hypothetical protein